MLVARKRRATQTAGGRASVNHSQSMASGIRWVHANAAPGGLDLAWVPEHSAMQWGRLVTPNGIGQRLLPGKGRWTTAFAPLWCAATCLLFFSQAGCAPDPPTLAGPLAAPLPLPNTSPPLAYRLEAELLPATQTIRGSLTLRFRNASPRALQVLPFHLYLNAFSSEETLFARTSGGEHRGFAKGARGWSKIASAVVNGRTIQPRPGEDPTVALLPLGGMPITPGAEVTVALRFVAKLPAVYARTGHAGEFFFAGQWFPKLGFLRPDGSWHCPPLHANAEFFSAFADYQVELRLPARFVVGATGRQLKRRLSGGQQILSFGALWVHDFAFCAWPHFVRQRSRLGRVSIELLSPPGRAGAVARRQLALVRYGLARLGQWFGGYPYPTLTVVDIPLQAAGASGMEYPTLFTVAMPLASLALTRSADELTLHELTHQYFQGIVATNEADEPWLDEGLTTFVSGLLLDDWLGEDRSLLRLPGLARGQRHKVLAHAALVRRQLPIGSRADQFSSWTSYAATIYGRAAALLYRLSDRIGRPAVLSGLRRYVDAHRFGHPSSDDLRRALVAACRPEDRGAIDRWLRQAIAEGVSLEQLGAPPARLFGGSWRAAGWIVQLLELVGP